MLGEDHSILHEFPEYAEKVQALKKADPDFGKQCDRYDALDAQIRELELVGSPISDADMRELKHERRTLKDQLCEQLRAD